jgi:hypothetical protein
MMMMMMMMIIIAITTTPWSRFLLLKVIVAYRLRSSAKGKVKVAQLSTTL